MGRAPCCEKVGLKRGRWTAEEDERLTNYILQHGQGSWRSLPKNAGLLRCGKSCRLRWINYLRSDLKRGDITPQEENTIIKLHATLGNRWSSIAAQLSGRTDNEIKNYWNSHLSRRIHTIRSPNGEENVINLSSASAPPKRRGGRTSRATMQRNKINNALDNNNNDNSNTNELNDKSYTNNNNAAPQLGQTLENNLMIGDEDLIFDDIMGLDGILSDNFDVSLNGPNDSNGLICMGPLKVDQEQSSGLAGHMSSSIASNGGASTPSSPSTLSCFDQFEIGNEKEQMISWLWENDDNYFRENIFSDVPADDIDFGEEQAMVEWLLS